MAKKKMGLIETLFGQNNRARARRDQYRPSTFVKNAISPINTYGTCFSCDGTGKVYGKPPVTSVIGE